MLPQIASGPFFLVPAFGDTCNRAMIRESMIFAIRTNRIGDPLGHQDLAQEHHDYVDSLRSRGLILAGTLGPQGERLLLLRAKNLQQATAIARQAPTVRAGIDSYQVHQLDLTSDPLGLDEGSISAADLGKAEPLLRPSGEMSFEVVDSASDPRFTHVRQQCFAPAQIQEDDPHRKNYLRLAEENGLKKLLLLYDDQLAGQIEFAPPEAAGLPIQGNGVTVINCLWVLDAYAGLEGGRRLLAACAEDNPNTKSLATVAFSPSSLQWLPGTFFDRQKFKTIAEIDTGRLFGDTPIVAQLLWRPLSDDATPPTWNEEALLSGVDFCPAYPWLFGKRLYWGRSFAYRAVIVKEGLRRPELLDQFPILGTHKTMTWTLVKLGIPATDLARASDLIQRALVEEPTYYAYLYAQENNSANESDNQELRVIFPYRKYQMTTDRSSWGEAIRYGLDKGIPREELVFTPFPFENEKGS
jgi:hypothetical protein